MKVLVIEDDVKIGSTVRRGLEAEGFTVEWSRDGLDGVWRATEGHFDVIVLDILLPGLNGFQVCRRLRDAGNWTPLLMLTAKSGELDEAEGLDTGADDYLTKPRSTRSVGRICTGVCRNREVETRSLDWRRR